MKSSVNIRLLGSSNNERGDLFTRLTKDLFFALGYHNVRLNVHKSGRELDLIGEHRFEPRGVIAECKAQQEKIGGAELNKFFGVLTRERKKSAPTGVAGYFVSLAGFTETAIEQEVETDADRLILLDGPKVVTELERFRVVVERSEAAERAGQCAAQAELIGASLDGLELLGHESGYLWVIYYEQAKKRSHFALIHADGTPLSEMIAHDVIKVEKLSGGSLHSLKYLPPPSLKTEDLNLASKVVANYRRWLGEECGYIYLDGMPADTDLSATRLKLERLFVPLKGTFLPKLEDPPEVQKELGESTLSFGEILDQASHLAILAAPGGGKSTLLKRLATAYAFAERREEISDDLPRREWMPLFLRCRELRDRAYRPILELLDDISLHAGMSANESEIFQQSIHGALHAGKALLLIDGLDEISDEGARQVFASHLRTFIGMFPQAAVVVTSREAGFRLVAGVIASACRQAKLAPLDQHDVLNLCERWHVEVLGGSDRVRAEAKVLGESIWANERIRQLAQNPLLLTTLLVVRRWIGELPRSRAALYREAIRVLVRTWNVEGFAPLDEDETLAQLSYVACAMMEEGKQQIGQKALLKLLQFARRELEAELQFARVSPQEFVNRIEYRSSLLMQTGYEQVDGSLEPVYEFRHLTFQEYLAARGFVEEQYAGRELGKSLGDLLGSHFYDEGWEEVIPLAAVLAGRKAEDLIKRLISVSQQVDVGALEGDDLIQAPVVLLHQCICDEVQITTPTLRTALLELGRYPEAAVTETWVTEVLRTKFGPMFRELVESAYLSGVSGFEEYIDSLEELAIQLYFKDGQWSILEETAEKIQNDLKNGDRLTRIYAALGLMRLAYETLSDSTAPASYNPFFSRMVDGLAGMLKPNDLPTAIAASWALAWFGANRLVADPPDPDWLLAAYELWRQIGSRAQAHFFAWAFASQRLLPRNTFSNSAWGDCETFLREMFADQDNPGTIRIAALVVGWYRHGPWTDVELCEALSGTINYATRKTAIEVLESFGEYGRHALTKLQKKSTYDIE